MKINKKTDILEQSGGFWLGGTIVRIKGEWVLAADCMEKSDGVKYSKIFRSTDGKSWREQGFFERSEAYGAGNVRRDGYGALYADEKLGLLFNFGTELYWENDQLDSTWRMRKLYYRISKDCGRTWSDKIQIIQQGLEYDETHYMKNVTFGRNMACFVVPKAVPLPDGSLLIGVQSQIADENGEAGPTGMGYLQCGALRGLWNPASQRFDWDFGEWITLPLDISTRGLYEPAHSLLPDGRILMVCRGSNYTKEDSIIGCKFYCLSEDNGRTWSNPKPLAYEDGSIMFASSCSPKLITHPNGKIYFIGIINGENPKGNLPRYPLCIAEIDPAICKVIKTSVTVIDTKPEEVDDTQPGIFPVDFSNQWAHTEQSGTIVITAPYRPDATRFEGILNQYELEL